MAENRAEPRSLLQPTWLKGMQDAPQFEDRKKMWLELRIEPQPIAPAVRQFADLLRAVYTEGDVRVGSFRIHENEVFDWYASRNRLPEAGFFTRFWSLEAVRTLMPEPLHDLNFYSRDVFCETSAFLLGGSLAWTLAGGGAYGKHLKGPRHAKEVADQAAAELIHHRYDEVLVYESHVAWSEFFLDVAWDHSWVALDRRLRLVHVLCATDTD